MSTAFWNAQDVDSMMGIESSLHPGDLVAGLVNLKNQVIDGRVDPEEFVAVLQERDAQVAELFRHLDNELKLPLSAAVYREALQRAVAQTRGWLSNILTLLRAGLGEMAVYPQDWDVSHLEQGIVLVAKGEHELIDAAAVLSDAQHHPMSLIARHGGLVSEMLAARFDGRLTADEMARELTDLEREMSERFQRALVHLDEMKQYLLQASKPADAAVQSAVRRLKLAEMDVSGAWDALQHAAD